LDFFGAAPGFNTSLAFNFANPRITDEFVRIAPGHRTSAACFNSVKSFADIFTPTWMSRFPDFIQYAERVLIHSISLIAVPSHRLDRWGNTFKYAGEINADPSTVRERAQELHEQALANDAAKDVDIAKLHAIRD
jgi:hypothetical protein